MTEILFPHWKKNEIIRPVSYAGYWFIITICLICLLCLLISPVSAESYERITNGGFEGSPAMVAWDTTCGSRNAVPYHGSWAYDDFGSDCSISQSVEMTNLTTSLTFYGSTGGTYGMEIHIKIDNSTVETKQMSDIGGAWQGFSTSLSTYSGYHYLTLSTYRGEPTNIRIDDVSLFSGSPPPAPPVADFTASPNPAFQNIDITFSDTSINTPTSWYWMFGDGTTSTEQNPVKSYPNIGTYTINHSATNDDGTSWNNKTDYITINDGTFYTHNIYVNRYDNNNPISGATITTVNEYGSTSGLTNGEGYTSVLLQNVNTTFTLFKSGYTTLSGYFNTSEHDTYYKMQTATNNSNNCENIVANPIFGNTPLYVDFTDISGVNETSHTWIYGEGLGDNQPDNFHTYILPNAVFTVTLNKVLEDSSIISYTCPALVQTSGDIITPITTEPTFYPTVTQTTFPLTIPITTPIPNKNTVYYTVKNSSGYSMPNVGIQQWEYKYGDLDFLHLFGKHPEQIDGGFTDSNGNFMALENSGTNYDYKIGGNVNLSLLKTYTSSLGSFELPPDKYINGISNLYGFNTTLYTLEIRVLDQSSLQPVNDVLIAITNKGLLYSSGNTDINGKVLFLVLPDEYYVGLSKEGYYNGYGDINITNYAQSVTYYLKQKPVTTNPTITPTTIPIYTTIPYTTLPIINRSVCRNQLDFDNETFASPFLNIEACLGIVNPTYQNYILSCLICVVFGILIGKKQKSLEAVLIGIFIGMLISVFIGLISWGIWFMLLMPLAAIYILQMEKGGKK